MVDSLAITESTEGMEDKMTSFAVACAQLGLKLEFFGRKVSSDGACVMKNDVKANMAVLLTKVIRLLGSGVSIDQNHYLLTAKRVKAVDPVTGQITLEIPPRRIGISSSGSCWGLSVSIGRSHAMHVPNSPPLRFKGFLAPQTRAISSASYAARSVPCIPTTLDDRRQLATRLEPNVDRELAKNQATSAENKFNNEWN